MGEGRNLDRAGYPVPGRHQHHAYHPAFRGTKPAGLADHDARRQSARQQLGPAVLTSLPHGPWPKLHLDFGNL